MPDTPLPAPESLPDPAACRTPAPRAPRGTARVDAIGGGELTVDPDTESDARDLPRELDVVDSRIRRVRGDAQGWLGPLPERDRSQERVLEEMLATPQGELGLLLPRLEGGR